MVQKKKKKGKIHVFKISKTGHIFPTWKLSVVAAVFSLVLSTTPYHLECIHAHFPSTYIAQVCYLGITSGILVFNQSNQDFDPHGKFSHLFWSLYFVLFSVLMPVPHTLLLYLYNNVLKSV